MKILSVAHALPSRLITVDWIVSKLRRVNAGRLDETELMRVEELVSGFLDGAGSCTKYQVDDGETAIDIAIDACGSALSRAGVATSNVDFVLYCGVGRGWLEPSTAAVLQHGLSLDHATGFDILDGCVGWLRALQIARAMINNGEYRTGLIVSCECGFADFGKWKFNSVKELEPYLATFTIGEAATATVVTASEEFDDFYFNFRTFGEHADLCMIPLPNASQFHDGETLRHRAPLKFFADSRTLLSNAVRRIIETFEADEHLRAATYDVVFGHAASEKASEIVCQAVGVPLDVYYPTHAEYGNTVSSSVPLAMSLAIGNGRMRTGDRALAIVAGSGITIGIGSFTF